MRQKVERRGPAEGEWKRECGRSTWFPAFLGLRWRIRYGRVDDGIRAKAARWQESRNSVTSFPIDRLEDPSPSISCRPWAPHYANFLQISCPRSLPLRPGGYREDLIVRAFGAASRTLSAPNALKATLLLAANMHTRTRKAFLWNRSTLRLGFRVRDESFAGGLV